MREDRRDSGNRRPRSNDREGGSFGGGYNSGPRSGGFGGGSRGGGFNNRPQNRSFSGPREMHKAICADCQASCDVPFKPIEGKPVYCRDCFAKRRDRD